MTQQQLGNIIDKKRTYISRVENNGSNLTLKTLFDIVEKGLSGKVKISLKYRKMLITKAATLHNAIRGYNLHKKKRYQVLIELILNKNTNELY